MTISYDRESLVCVYRGQTLSESVFNVAKTGQRYTGTVTNDYYGRPSPKYAHGTGNIDRWTSSTRRIMDAMLGIYDRVVDPDLLVRRVNVVAANLILETAIPEKGPEQLSLFVDYEAQEKRKAQEDAADDKERRI